MTTSISVNGQSQVPPGFRFHPTEEELLQYYLKKKVVSERIDLDVIQDVDLNKLEPWDIQEKCRIGSTPQNDWYFFSHKDKKYPTGTRTNRATASGFWKATGRDKVIYGSNSRRIGMRKTLVFYKGRAPHGQKSDWIMHEYRLDDNAAALNDTNTINVGNATGEGAQEEGWVICRVFKKKSHLISHKTSNISPMMGNTTWSNIGTINSPSSCTNEGTLEEMLHSMGARRNQQQQHHHHSLSDNYNMRRFLKLPSLLDSPSPSCNTLMNVAEENTDNINADIGIQDWAALDRLVASSHDLNAQNYNKHEQVLNNNGFGGCPDHELVLQLQQQQQQQYRSSSSSSSTRLQMGDQDNYNDHENELCDLWNFTRSSNDQLCHLSNVPV